VNDSGSERTSNVEAMMYAWESGSAEFRDFQPSAGTATLLSEFAGLARL
jgi:hypothetical protein